MSMELIDLKEEYDVTRDRVTRRMQSVLDRGRRDSGPEIAELEARLCSWTNAAHCVTVASGTEALQLALMALGVGPGDEVVTTPFSCSAHVDAIRLAGAVPVFADIDPATCNLDPGTIEPLLGARTQAILPVSLYGQPADMDEINAIARRNNVHVVENAAQSFGATYGRKQSCNLSSFGCTSFSPNKPIGGSGGGALFTNDEAFAIEARELRDHLRRVRAAHQEGAWHMDALQCATVLGRLERYEWELAQRRRVAASYDALFSGRIQRVGRHRDRTSTFAHYTIALDERDRVRAELLAAGIPVTVNYPEPVHARTRCAEEGPDPCPVATRMAGMVLSLPIGAYFDPDRAHQVAQAVLRAAGVAVPASEDPACLQP
jgi:UDP-2-acetamido-2-deoxy-ribo-hexuluronate aminotransferase